MATHSPKRVAAKLQKVIDAWMTIRPTKTFSGLTLEQFKAQVQPSLAARDQLTVLGNQTTDSRMQRRLSDDASLTLAQQVVSSVKGDPAEGGNGPLYAAMGYVPKSMKASGLTRKGQTAPVVQAAATPAVTATNAAK
jgi:phospholipase/lecithinase/hemolysin